MPDSGGNIPRAKMTAQERQVRSQLAQLVNQRGVMRGSLSVRRRVCGKAGCKCTRGQLHESLYLVLSEEGRTRQLYVPRAFEARVRQWVENHRRARRLMEEISRRYWKRVRDRQD